jgi:hypothetical protein
MAIGNILLPFGIFGNLGTIWYIFPRFGILFQEKAGSPAESTFQRSLDRLSRVLKVHMFYCLLRTYIHTYVLWSSKDEKSRRA